MEDVHRACPCKRLKCERYGKCAECMQYHEKYKKYPPYCKRKGKGEKIKETDSALDEKGTQD